MTVGFAGFADDRFPVAWQPRGPGNSRYPVLSSGELKRAPAAAPRGTADSSFKNLKYLKTLHTTDRTIEGSAAYVDGPHCGCILGGMSDQPESIYSFTADDIEGHAVDLNRYRGKVVLIVNVASGCGFTPQYAPQDLYKKHQQQGFEILGFPCNQFGGQEPEDEKTIQSFCSKTMR